MEYFEIGFPIKDEALGIRGFWFIRDTFGERIVDCGFGYRSFFIAILKLCVQKKSPSTTK